MKVGVWDVALTTVLFPLKEGTLDRYTNRTEQGVAGSAEAAWRRTLSFLTLQDILRLECVSKAFRIAVQSSCYESLQIGLLDELRITNGCVPSQDPRSLLNPTWTTQWGLRAHLAALRCMALHAAIVGAEATRAQIDAELHTAREVCEFLKQQKSVENFADPATSRMLNEMVRKAVQHPPQAFRPDERRALCCLAAGIGKLTGTEPTIPPSFVPQHYKSVSLGEPYKDPKQFFHSLLTEFVKFVQGLKQLQKAAVRSIRELQVNRHQRIGVIENCQRNLKRLAESLRAEVYSVDLQRLGVLMGSSTLAQDYPGLYMSESDRQTLAKYEQRKLDLARQGNGSIRGTPIFQASASPSMSPHFSPLLMPKMPNLGHNLSDPSTPLHSRADMNTPTTATPTLSTAKPMTPMHQQMPMPLSASMAQHLSHPAYQTWQPYQTPTMPQYTPTAPMYQPPQQQSTPQPQPTHSQQGTPVTTPGMIKSAPLPRMMMPSMVRYDTQSTMPQTPMNNYTTGGYQMLNQPEASSATPNAHRPMMHPGSYSYYDVRRPPAK